ncbi:MAG: serine/threonine-protein phosphatase [Leptospiraceae bacterium]|nr:serine/threonine-protein phosphatase [Leptospiraceae bacterium]
MSLMKSFLEFKDYFINSNKLFFSSESQVDELENYFEDKIDLLFVYFLFIAQFVQYLILSLLSANITNLILKESLLITFISFVLLFFAKNKKVFSIAIYLSSLVINFLIFYSVAKIAIYYSDSLDVSGINNLYISLSFLLLVHAFRLRKFSCIIPGIEFVALHLLSLYCFTITSHWELDAFLFIPDILFIITTIIGTGVVINRREDFREIHNLNKEKSVMSRELELAKKVQDSLFPKDIKIDGLRYEVFRQSHNYIGGDFYDFVMLREGNAGIFITDIAGHGISSAMVATIMKVIVATIPYQFKLKPDKFLGHLDTRLAVDLDHYHASAIYMFLNFQTKKMLLGNAGHPYLLYSSRDGQFTEIKTEGSILGFQIKDPIVTEVELSFDEGDRFMMYTDGLIESPTIDGKYISEKVLIDILNNNKDVVDIKDLKNIMLNELSNKYGLKKFTDDTMFLLFEITSRRKK